MASANDQDTNRLKKQVQLQIQKCKEIQLDKEELENKLAEKEAENTQLQEQIQKFMEYKYNITVNQQELVAQEQQRYEAIERKNVEEIRKLNFELSQEQSKNQRQANLIEEKDEIIQKFIMKLRDTPGTQNLKDFMEEIEEFKEDRVANVHQLQKQQMQITELNQKIESLVIQNRVLSKMANVEDDFIIDITEIKMAEEQKTQDYKVQVRYLEQEIEQLEAERQQLRHQLRIATTLFSSNPGERYQGLDKDQLFLLDQYALNLRNGQAQIPLNDRSKELEEENKELRIQLKMYETKFIIQTQQQPQASQQYIQQSQITKQQLTVTQLNDSKVEVLEKQNQDIKNYIKELIETMQQPGGQEKFARQTSNAGFGQYTMPPMVQGGGPMGNFDYGYSYRFQTKMPIDFQDYYQENDEFIKGIQVKQEIAFLQLQNLETLKLLQLKESEYEGLVADSNWLKSELKTCLQVQDEMVKRYRSDKTVFSDQIQTLKKEKDELADMNEEQKLKLKAYDSEISRIESKNENQYEVKLANYAKRIAQLDVNLLRLSRKYDCLQSNERDLRVQYNNIHKEYAEKVADLQIKLNEAISYKKKAREQLRIVLTKLQHSFPSDKKKNLEAEISDLTTQLAQMKERNSDLNLKLTVKDSYERQVFEKDEQLKQKEEELLEIELELEIMKDRLIRLDPIYRKYVEVFEKLAEQINKRSLSPLEVFQLIDTNGDRHINKMEFNTAMQQMQIKIDKNDEDTLFMFLDLDGSGEIEYNEFALKLKRSGVKIKKKEEELIYNIHGAIKMMGLTLREAFDAFDSDKDQKITKRDMKIVLREMNETISDSDLDYFIKIADVDGDKAIQYEEFARLFQDIIQDSKMDVRKNELEWQFALLVTLNGEMQKAGLKLLDFFKVQNKDYNNCLNKDIDLDQNDKIDYAEFQKLFNDMCLEIEENELKGLFNMIDKDHNAFITYDEMQKAIREAMREQERVRRQQLLDERTDQLRKQKALIQKEDHIQKEFQNQPGITETSRLEMKVKTMEVRQGQQLKWLDTFRKQLDQKDKTIDEYVERIQQLESGQVDQAVNYQQLSGKYRVLQLQSERGISTIQAEHLTLTNDRLKMENVELRGAMETFKQLYEAAIHQVQLLKYTLDKQKDETSVTKETIMHLQSQSDEKALVGKIMHEMLMVKQSAAETNRKWESQLDQTRKQRVENEQLTNDVVKKEEEVFEVFTVYREKELESQDEIEGLKKQIIPGVSLSNVNKMNHQLQQVIQMKNELEDINKKLREKNSELEMQVSCIEETKAVLEDIELRLKRSNGGIREQDQRPKIIETLVSLIKNILYVRAEQKVTMAYEKEIYLQRVIKTNQDQIDDLQRELADWDTKYSAREKFWQEQVSKQKKMLYKSPSGMAGSGDSKDKDMNEFNFLSTLQQKIKQGQDITEKDQHKLTNVGREKFMQEITKQLQEIKELREVIANQEKEIQKKNQLVEELDMKNMGGGNFNYERMKAQAKEEETDKVTQAAAKTISIMQGMIDDKTNQIKKKEEIISKMRQDFAIQKEADTEQINHLRSDIMKQDEKFLSMPIQGGDSISYFQQQEQLIRGGQKSTNEFLKLEQELDFQKNELESQKLIIKSLESEKQKLREKLREEQYRYSDLLTEMEMQKKQNDPTYLRHEVETLKKIIKKKDSEIKGFQAAIGELKKETFSAMDQADSKEKEQSELTKKLTKETIDKKDLERKTEQYLGTIEKLDDEVSNQKKLAETATKESIHWKNKYYEVKDKQFDQDDKLSDKQWKENKDSQITMKKQFKKESKKEGKKEGKDFRKEGKESKKIGKQQQINKEDEGIQNFLDMQTSQTLQQKEVSELKQQIKELKDENCELSKVQQRSRSKLFFDEQQCLSRGINTGGFLNYDELKRSISQFLKENWWVNLASGMRSHAAKQEKMKWNSIFKNHKVVEVEEYIYEEQFWKELSALNIHIHERDKQLLKQRQPWNDYVAFYYEVKEMKCQCVGDFLATEEIGISAMAATTGFPVEKRVLFKEEPEQISPDQYYEEKLQTQQKRIIELNKYIRDLEKKLEQEEKKARGLESQIDSLSNMTTSSLKKQFGTTQPMKSSKAFIKKK